MTRKIVRRTTHRVVGYHASRKNGALVPWESQVERGYFQWLEVDPRIVSFRSQPKTFKWTDFRYTPDALVETREGSFFAEVKPDEALEDDVVMARLEEISRRLRAENIEFKLALRSEIFQEPLRGNVVRLMRETKRPLDTKLVRRIFSFIGHNRCQLGMLAHHVCDGEISPVLRCVAQGYLSLNLNQQITPETFLTAIKEMNHGTFSN
ncbi:Tn7 transposase TnsA N-terminal domain-containing protein [Kordiimonas sp.]|uniref:Tn7 transposase TnsA N-terminal domain-containing protein n=1 Tax=Kordiimonas sp. TaxID=1970157 RepID=UPI003B516CE8